ncbi:MAG: SelB C-terminal domain-containing protein, partial [Desulfuromonadaceae bacterium]
QDAPCCRVSSRTGAGIPELVAAITTLAAVMPTRDADGPMRLPIDRHFSRAGFGTIVTGTLLSGTVRSGDFVEVVPPGIPVRVREIQIHGENPAAARAGQRVALNLAGIDCEQIRRGAVVATRGLFTPTERLDARLHLLPTAPHPLRFRAPVHFYLGTARAVGRVALLDRDSLPPGENALAQIHLDRPLITHRLDRFILRSYSPMTTIGGGLIIDPAPAKHKRFRNEVMTALQELEAGDKAFLLQKLAERHCLRLKELELASGLGRDRIEAHLRALTEEQRVVQLGDQWVLPSTLTDWCQRLTAETCRYHQQNPLQPGIPHATLKGVLPDRLSAKAYEQLLARAVQEKKLRQQQEWVQQTDFRPRPDAAQQQTIDRIESAYRQEGALARNKNAMLENLGLAVADCDDFFAYLFATSRLIKLNDESFFHRDTFEQALQLLRDHFAQQRTLTMAEFRDQLGSARKQTQALLEYFDRQKYTLRQEDVRVAWQLPATQP